MSELFDPGYLVISAAVYRNMRKDVDYYRFVMDSLKRHEQGDWGVHDEYINGTNDLRQKDGQIYSAYEYREFIGEPGALIIGQQVERVTVIVITTSLQTPQTQVVSLPELMSR